MKKNYTLLLLFLMVMAQAQEQTVLTKISRNQASSIADYFDASLAPFYHGVASGDPTDSAVIIWTRVTTNTPSIIVNWSVASDPAMTTVIASGTYTTSAAVDYTVKVDVTGLNPNTSYYYQFETLGQYSLIGKTRTAPTGNVANVRFGVVSCSNYQNGYFNGYQELADRTDIDAILHLGDYIYEYESGGYGYDDTIGRGHLPTNETITLSDYRVRYSYYRLDAMLRNLHQQHPFILIWDDHEFSDDANKFGALNHDPTTEGSWIDRKNNAHKAYFEWMPVRANTIEEYRLYRTFSYGNLVDLIMLDTRIQGREEVITAKAASMSKKERKALIKTVISTANLTSIQALKETLNQIAPLFIDITKLSKEEYNFVLNTFARLAFEYKQTGKKHYLTEGTENKIAMLLQKSSLAHQSKATNPETKNAASYASILGLEQYNWLLNELSASTATWRIIGNQVMMMPYDGVTTDDAWDGYPEERANILEHLNINGITNNVVLTGDIHSMFSGVVKHNGTCQAVEFVVPSITSENLDAYGGAATWLAESWTLANNWHMYDVSLDVHGYYILDVKEDRVQADWYAVNDITVPNSGQYYFKSWYTDKDACNLVETTTPAEHVLSYGDFPEEVITNQNTNNAFVVLGVYPNPMNTYGNIHYVVNNMVTIQATIYDVTGQKIKDVLVAKKHTKGLYNLNFSTELLQTGSYFLKITADNHTITKKIIIN